MVSFRAISWSDEHAVMLFEILTRIFLVFTFHVLERVDPFERLIHSDELWLYKNPNTTQYVPGNVLWLLVLLLPCVVFFLHYCIRRNRKEFWQALLALSLAVAINANVTELIKVIVGRPRPDFLSRCFPDGEVKWTNKDPEDSLGLSGSDISASCTGDAMIIRDGRKSFPSGHSSFSFSGLGFLSLWLCSELRVFSSPGSGRGGGAGGEGWRLVVALLPLLAAASVALSRTCDYHHHWQDVVVGSLLGYAIAYVSFRLYYPTTGSSWRGRCNACGSVNTITSSSGGSSSKLQHDSMVVNILQDHSIATGPPMQHLLYSNNSTASSSTSSQDVSSATGSSSRLVAPGLGNR